jgi:hypothetical protein
MAKIERPKRSPRNLYVRTDEGAKVLLSPDQQAFLKAAFELEGTPLEPTESVTFTSNAERIADRLGWSLERSVAIGRELEAFGLLAFREND